MKVIFEPSRMLPQERKKKKLSSGPASERLVFAGVDWGGNQSNRGLSALCYSDLTKLEYGQAKRRYVHAGGKDYDQSFGNPAARSSV